MPLLHHGEGKSDVTNSWGRESKKRVQSEGTRLLGKAEDSLRIGSLNCNSLVNKTAGVLEHLEDQLVDICLLQETYLRKGDEAKFQEIKDRGWEIFSAPRKERTGGGVAVIYKAGMGVKSNSTRNFTTFEYMEVVLENSTELFRLINIYRPPYSKKAPYTQSHFLEEFKDFLEDIGNKVGKSLIMGDFNFHMERPTDFYHFSYCQQTGMLSTSQRGGCSQAGQGAAGQIL